jgi:hypothetical protein
MSHKLAKRSRRLVLNRDDDGGNESFQTITFNLQTTKASVRHEMLEGRPHIVVPMVMITEGVHNGSQGRLFYSANELSKTPEMWDHKPVSVYHPRRGSACSIANINAHKVGIILNTEWDESKKRLKAEAWLEEARIEKVDRRVMNAIDNEEMMEVSTGLYSYNEKTTGTWGKKKEEYDRIATNIRADHLALLPDKKGACSIADGAGLLRNSVGDDEVTVSYEETQTALKAFGINYLSEEMEEELTDNDLSFDEIREMLVKAVKEKLGIKDKYYYGLYIVTVYDDYFIFQNADKMYRMDYSYGTSSVTLSGSAVEVKRVVTYVPVSPANNAERKERVQSILHAADASPRHSKRTRSILAANRLSK